MTEPNSIPDPNKTQTLIQTRVEPISQTNHETCRHQEAKVADVGLSRVISSRLAASAGADFTWDWASPEQILGQPLTLASDIFSFGVILWELITGDRPHMRSCRKLRCHIICHPQAHLCGTWSLPAEPSWAIEAMNMQGQSMCLH